MVCRNKDFLKEVLSGSKALLPLNKVKRVNMPHYDELSVFRLWPEMKNDSEFMKYFPSKFPERRLPDQNYFFNILNTVMEVYFEQIMSHANKARTSGTNEA